MTGCKVVIGVWVFSWLCCDQGVPSPDGASVALVEQGMALCDSTSGKEGDPALGGGAFSPLEGILLGVTSATVWDLSPLPHNLEPPVCEKKAVPSTS